MYLDYRIQGNLPKSHLFCSQLQRCARCRILPIGIRKQTQQSSATGVCNQLGPAYNLSLSLHESMCACFPVIWVRMLSRLYVFKWSWITGLWFPSWSQTARFDAFHFTPRFPQNALSSLSASVFTNPENSSPRHLEHTHLSLPEPLDTRDASFDSKLHRIQHQPHAPPHTSTK